MAEWLHFDLILTVGMSSTWSEYNEQHNKKIFLFKNQVIIGDGKLYFS